jgi:hypothetical protein
LTEPTWADVEAAVRAINPADVAEYIYAVTYLPEWIWASVEGMRGLVAEARVR